MCLARLPKTALCSVVRRTGSEKALLIDELRASLFAAVGLERLVQTSQCLMSFLALQEFVFPYSHSID